MSPASGDNLTTKLSLLVGSFHSINVPSEWGPSHQTTHQGCWSQRGFHSINVPSEWGHYRLQRSRGYLSVSIQLMSPASGDGFPLYKLRLRAQVQVSIQLMSPASGDSLNYLPGNWPHTSFHSINVPSEWGLNSSHVDADNTEGFHSINVPSEWGLQL